MLTAFDVSAAEKPLSTTGDYQKYIGALLQVKDFGIHYYGDGAADATVLFPSSSSTPHEKPREQVASLVRLGTKSFPLLIDCLGDGRLTSVEFGGNTPRRQMKVPVGYVCLDILMGIAKGRSISNPDCADDGLGACMNRGYYFRPDDYYNCIERTHSCDARQLVGVAQQNWRQQFLQGQLYFHNPYDDLNVPEYRDLMSPGK